MWNINTNIWPIGCAAPNAFRIRTILHFRTHLKNINIKLLHTFIIIVIFSVIEWMRCIYT